MDSFKRVFTLPKKKSAAEPDSQSIANGGSGGGGLAALFGGNDRNRTSSTANRETGSTESFPKATLDNDTVKDAAPSTPKAAPATKPTIVTAPATPPNLVGTPTTLVTPPTPTDPRPTSPTSPYKQALNASAEKVAGTANSSPTSLNGAAQRRRTGTFTNSKLSNTLNSSPLTPHIEEAKTPGGTLTSPTAPAGPAGAGGFFTSVFTAAQNAANQLSNSINTSIVPNQKIRSPRTEQTGSAGGEEVIPGPKDKSIEEAEPGAKRELAVETLGKGDLSLSHLGISESSEVSPMTSNTNLAETPAQFPPHDQVTDDAQKAEESAAARAVSVAYEKPVQTAVAQATGGRPLSMTSIEGSEAGIQTPPRQSMTQDELRRTGSVRSKISERRHRHRGSSAATGQSTLAAAITASASTLANPGGNGPGHRLTGFAVASSKRNKDFHQLFRSVPEDDYLIEDYSAALQRDILLHGRLYISEGHICFSSNILGWVTNLVISFDEVVTVEKKNTAVIFPNAIVIQTLHARNIFASLVARESTYDLLIGIWKISHPNLKSSLNGVVLDNSGTGDKTEKAESLNSEDASEDGSEDDVYDEDDDEDLGSFYEAGGSIAGSDMGDVGVNRKTSAPPITAGNSSTSATAKGVEHLETVLPGASAASESPGPATHAPTECGDEGSHYDRPLTDTTIPAPLGKVYNMMWGPASSAFMKRWLVDDQKSRELAFEDDKIGLDDTHREKTYSYIKPLNAPVGPKQTKCITTCTVETFDLEKAVVINCSTQTPDVPSGNVFTTKTRYCLMWGPGNSTRMIATCTIEWTGKSWLKGKHCQNIILKTSHSIFIKNR